MGKPRCSFVVLHIVAFFGLALSLNPWLSDGMNTHGVLLGCIASVSFAGYLACAAALSRLRVPARVVAIAVNGGQTLLFGFVSVGGALRWGLPTADQASVTAFGFGVLGYFAAQAFLYAALAFAREGPLVAFFLNAEPLVSILLAVVVLGGHLVWYRWIGVLVLVASFSASSIVGTKTPKVHPSAETVVDWIIPIGKGDTVDEAQATRHL